MACLDTRCRKGIDTFNVLLFTGDADAFLVCRLLWLLFIRSASWLYYWLFILNVLSLISAFCSKVSLKLIKFRLQTLKRCCVSLMISVFLNHRSLVESTTETQELNIQESGHQSCVTALKILDLVNIQKTILTSTLLLRKISIWVSKPQLYTINVANRPQKRSLVDESFNL